MVQNISSLYCNYKQAKILALTDLLLRPALHRDKPGIVSKTEVYENDTKKN